MQNKYIKTWLSIFVISLAIVGGTASYAARGKMFYKGIEKQVSGIRHKVSELEDAAKTSVLHVEEEDSVIPAEAGISSENDITPKMQPVAPPCVAGENPVIKNGRVSGCSSREEKKPEPPPQVPVKISAPLAPAPKVKILSEPSAALQPTINYKLSTLNPQPSSCESSGLFTYTGPDRPGLLYGMCLDCPANAFILNGGKC